MRYSSATFGTLNPFDGFLIEEGFVDAISTSHKWCAHHNCDSENLLHWESRVEEKNIEGQLEDRLKVLHYWQLRGFFILRGSRAADLHKGTCYSKAEKDQPVEEFKVLRHCHQIVTWCKHKEPVNDCHRKGCIATYCVFTHRSKLSQKNSLCSTHYRNPKHGNNGHNKACCFRCYLFYHNLVWDSS